MKKLVWLCFVGCYFSPVDAQQGYENNIFGLSQEQKLFATEQQLSEYIKTNKPSTFRYFERLSISGKRKVFEQYKNNPTQDITEVIVRVYRQQSR